MITCFIRYKLDLNKIKEFENYAKTWISLVEKYGGTHHGYFLPTNDFDDLDSNFSFPNLANKGPDDVAIALFSFPSIETYQSFRRDVAKDKDCAEITVQFNQAPCFLSYERSFLRPIFSNNKSEGT